MRNDRMRYTKMMQVLALAISVLQVPAAAADPVTARIPISCKSERADRQFSFVITSEESDAPMPETDTISLKDGETGAFVITYDKPDTWHYDIGEVQDSAQDEDIVYDNRTYRAMVFTGEHEDGTLYTELTCHEDGKAEKAASCSFTNMLTKAGGGQSTPDKDDNSASEKTSTGKEKDETDNANNGRKTNPAPGKTAQTGDRNDIIRYMILAMAALALIAVASPLKRKKKHKW